MRAVIANIRWRVSDLSRALVVPRSETCPITLKKVWGASAGFEFFGGRGQLER